MIRILLRKIISFPFYFKKEFYKLWNPFKFCIIGIKLGNNPMIYSDVYLFKDHLSSISIGNNFTFTSNDSHNPLCRNLKGCICAQSGAIVKIGDNVGMSSPSIWAYKSIKIGNNVKLGGDVIIIDSDSHSLNYDKRRNIESDINDRQDIEIVIDDDVWIGARSIILKGVHIGARTVIGAGSVVTKNLPPDCIAAGNPAKIIKYIKD